MGRHGNAIEPQFLANLRTVARWLTLRAQHGRHGVRYLR